MKIILIKFFATWRWDEETKSLDLYWLWSRKPFCMATVWTTGYWVTWGPFGIGGPVEQKGYADPMKKLSYRARLALARRQAIKAIW